MADSKPFVLVIDAGHGGHDPGATGAYAKEKTINLNTALAFGKYVERYCPDVKVIYTRKRDVFVPLHERAAIANRNHADVFISIHTNALEKGRIARGLETYTMGMRRSNEKLSAAQRENSVITIEDNYEEHYAGYDPNSPESEIMFEFIHDKNMAKSVELAQLVQSEVCSVAHRPNKGVKQDVFLVLRETSMPACLIELGYISTPDEESYLANSASIDRMAYGIYSAFAKYKDKNAVVTPYKADEPERVVLPSIVPQTDVANLAQENRHADRQKPAEESVRPVKEEKMHILNQHASNPEAQAVSDIRQDNDGPSFRVQFYTGVKVLPQGSKQFKGLKDVSHYRDGSVVKFTVGNFTTFEAANKYKRELIDRFPDAFVVAIHNGRRIDLGEARRMQRRQ